MGAINATLAVVGLYSQLHSAYFFLFKYTDPTAPASFKPVFAAMTLINLGFVGVLLGTALSFVRAKLSATNLYSLLVVLLFGYWITLGRLWRIGGGFGTSVAAATGVGNMGIGFFEFLFLVPCLYPFVSMVSVQVLKHLYSASSASLSTSSPTI
jgi:hypothetical protein